MPLFSSNSHPSIQLSFLVAMMLTAHGCPRWLVLRCISWNRKEHTRSLAMAKLILLYTRQAIVPRMMLEIIMKALMLESFVLLT